MAVTRETLHLIADLDRTVHGRIDDVTRDLTKAWAQAWDTLGGPFGAAVDGILAGFPEGWPSRRHLERDPALRAVLSDSARILDVLAGLVASQTAGAARAAAEAGADGQAAIIASQLPPQGTVSEASLGGFAERALAAIIARAMERITALARPLGRDADAAMRRELIRGVQLGLNPRDVARRIMQALEGAFNGGLSRALVIARTETIDAYRAAAAVGQNAQRDVLEGWTWLAQLDRRTCFVCWSQHGSQHSLDEPGPQGHPQCLPAGAVVAGPRALASTTRWFEGEVIDIEVDGGGFLSVTPNHPVLTTHGWVDAGELREGSHVIRGIVRQGPARSGDPNDHQVPALIEEVAATLGRTLPVPAVRMPTAPEDFHGDGAGSDVHVVRAHGLLRDDFQSAFDQHLGETFLGRGDPQLALLPGTGALDLSLDGRRNTTRRGVGSSGVPSVLFGCPRGHHDPVSVGHAARLNSLVAEAAVDNTARYPECLGQGVDGFASLVALNDLSDGKRGAGHHGRIALAAPDRQGLLTGSPEPTVDQNASEPGLARVVPSGSDLATFAGDVRSNRILNVRRRRFAGHVYNLQTSTGWFLANGIVVHNCRCTRAPAIVSWKDLGFDIPEPASLIPDARATFQGLSREDQLQIMGPARLELLDRGAIGWNDLAQLRDNPGWRPSYVPTPVRDLPRTA